MARVTTSASNFFLFNEFEIFKTLNVYPRSYTFPNGVRASQVVFQKVLGLFKSIPTLIPPEDLRGMGIQISRLTQVGPDYVEKSELGSSVSARATLAQWVQQTHNSSSSISSPCGQAPVQREVETDVDSDTEGGDSVQVVVDQGSGTKRSFAEVAPSVAPLNQSRTAHLPEIGRNPIPQLSQGGDYLIPSQIDNSVLRELPQHIQVEVRKKKSRRSKKVSAITDLFDTPSSTRASFSSERGKSIRFNRRDQLARPPVPPSTRKHSASSSEADMLTVMHNPTLTFPSHRIECMEKSSPEESPSPYSLTQQVFLSRCFSHPAHSTFAVGGILE